MNSSDDLRIEQHRARHGFSLIELLIALVLLEIGLLALVGIAASSTQDADRSGRDAAAVSLASARLERTMSLPCGGNDSGVMSAGPSLKEWYAQIVAPNGTRLISDSVIAVTTRGVHTTVLHTIARC
jgi:Tfp pilus assembly protein PilV